MAVFSALLSWRFSTSSKHSRVLYSCIVMSCNFSLYTCMVSTIWYGIRSTRQNEIIDHLTLIARDNGAAAAWKYGWICPTWGEIVRTNETKVTDTLELFYEGRKTSQYVLAAFQCAQRDWYIVDPLSCSSTQQRNVVTLAATILTLIGLNPCSRLSVRIYFQIRKTKTHSVPGCRSLHYAYTESLSGVWVWIFWFNKNLDGNCACLYNEQTYRYHCHVEVPQQVSPSGPGRPWMRRNSYSACHDYDKAVWLALFVCQDVAKDFWMRIGCSIYGRRTIVLTLVGLDTRTVCSRHSEQILYPFWHDPPKPWGDGGTETSL